MLGFDTGSIQYIVLAIILAGVRECNTATGDNKASGLQRWKPEVLETGGSRRSQLVTPGGAKITARIRYDTCCLYHTGAA